MTPLTSKRLKIGHIVFQVLVLAQDLFSAGLGPIIFCCGYGSRGQVALEGEISKSSVMKNLSRGERASGDLIPWTVSPAGAGGCVSLEKRVCLCWLLYVMGWEGVVCAAAVGRRWERGCLYCRGACFSWRLRGRGLFLLMPLYRGK